MYLYCYSLSINSCKSSIVLAGEFSLISNANGWNALCSWEFCLFDTLPPVSFVVSFGNHFVLASTNDSHHFHYITIQINFISLSTYSLLLLLPMFEKIPFFLSSMRNSAKQKSALIINKKGNAVLA